MAVAAQKSPVELDLGDQIEYAASAPGLDPAERIAKLRVLRDVLIGFLGRCDTYLGDLENQREALAAQEATLTARAREAADLRAELLRRGLATEEELDDAGLLSHEKLDEMLEEADLDESVFGFLHKYVEKLHPRDRSGKWMEKLGGKAESHPLAGHDGGKHAPGKERAGVKHNLGLPHAPAEPLLPRVEKAKRSGLTPESKLPKEEQTKRYERRKARFAGRVEKSVEKGKEWAARTDAEQHFNAQGKVSQRTLITYVKEALTQPSTLDQHSSATPSGERVWNPQRKALHDRIIQRFLNQRRLNPETGEWEFCQDCDPLPRSENPQVMFSGGGYAAGKGGIISILDAQGETPDSGYEGPGLVLDPDVIKSMLPEFQAKLENDPEANAISYEEAWHIAQEIQAQAQEKGVNVTVDGISNTSPQEMIDRVRSFTDKGYTAKAVYVDIPTDEAMSRAENRAKKAKKASDRRYIPEVIMRAVHRDVAATVPSLASEIDRLGLGDKFQMQVWDNDQGKDEVTGQFNPPKKFYDSQEPQSVLDDRLWQRLIAKGHEEIAGVDAPLDFGATKKLPPP